MVRLFLLLVLFLISSCSTSVSKPTISLREPFDELSHLVWEGDGRVKIQKGSDTYNMGMEAALQENGWSFGLNHPLKGEYLYTFQWSANGEILLSGNFPVQWDQEQLKDWGMENKQQLLALIATWGEMIRFAQLKNWSSCQKDENGHQCLNSELALYRGKEFIHLEKEKGAWSVELQAREGLLQFILRKKKEEKSFLLLQFVFSQRQSRAM